VGIRAWLCCDDIEAGQQWRKEILKAVKACTVFVPLVNIDWGNSGECEYECNLAINLTTHSVKVNGQRKPVILPVAFPDITFPAPAGMEHIEVLSANHQFIRSKDFVDWQQCVVRLVEAIQKTLGIKPGIPGLGAGKPASGGAGSGGEDEGGKKLKDMTVEELARWLMALHMKDAATICEQNATDGQTFLLLENRELLEMLKLTPLQIKRIQVEKEREKTESA